jgi:hypothetical protein
MGNEMSAADIYAMTRDNDGDGMGGMWNNPFVYLVWMWAFRSFGGGYGDGNAALQGALTRSELYDTMQGNQLDNGIRGVQQGLCDGFYALNTGLLTGFNGIQMQLAQNGFNAQQCCCETNRNIDAVRYENAQNTCAITNAIHAEGESTRALINGINMQNLRDKLEERDRDLLTANFQLSQQAQNAALINALRPTPIPAYVTCSPYQAANYGCCGNAC